MENRRRFMASSALALAASPALLSCDSAEHGGYADAARATWHHTDVPLAGALAVQREMVRYATLAPSSHNTQCWKFALDPGRISVFADLSRRCPAVDPDDHHLYVSLGCAVENLVQAAAALGFRGVPTFDEAAGAVNVELLPMKASRSALFEAIPQRQSTRARYDGKPVRTADLALLERAATGPGVRVMLFTDTLHKEQILEFVTHGNSSQIADAAFMAELETWIRFNGTDAARTGDGLYAVSAGNPNLPRWLGRAVMPLFFTARSENEKYAAQVRSSSGIAVFVSEASDKAHWVEAGRCYERFALQATALGLRHAMLNQPVEVAALRAEFARYLGLDSGPSGRPDLVVRFGHGAEMPRSLRRPLDAVWV